MIEKKLIKTSKIAVAQLFDYQDVVSSYPDGCWAYLTSLHFSISISQYCVLEHASQSGETLSQLFSLKDAQQFSLG